MFRIKRTRCSRVLYNECFDFRNHFRTFYDERFVFTRFVESKLCRHYVHLTCMMSTGLFGPQNKPFSLVKLSSSTLEGNDRYEGFGIDLIKELSEMSGFNYTFKIQEDANSGHIDDKTKKWTGMIGEVINGVSRGCKNEPDDGGPYF